MREKSYPLRCFELATDFADNDGPDGPLVASYGHFCWELCVDLAMAENAGLTPYRFLTRYLWPRMEREQPFGPAGE